MTFPDAPDGWTLIKHSRTSAYYEKDVMKVHATFVNGVIEFSISEHRIWLPGLFETLPAAITGFGFDRDELRRFQDVANVRGDYLITVDDFLGDAVPSRDEGGV